jgi:hypothetical protein
MRQAKKVSERRVMDETYKQVLEVGDIGVVYVKPKTRNTCDHPYLPVMVMRLSISGHSRTVSYKLCCKYGPLRGTYLRESIRFEEHLNFRTGSYPTNGCATANAFLNSRGS